jgi:hypothetical protein
MTCTADGVSAGIGTRRAPVFEGMPVLLNEEPAGTGAQRGLQPVPGMARLLTCGSSIPA